MDDRLRRSRLWTIGTLAGVGPHRRERLHERRISSTGGGALAGREHRWRHRERGPAGSPAAGTKHVAIVNKDMTDDEIKAAIAAEGGLVVGNWTYTANDELVKQFQQYVKDTYGVDIKFTYEGSQAAQHLPDQALRRTGGRQPRALRRARGRGELLGRGGAAKDAVESVLPSDLIPNQCTGARPASSTCPPAIAFQSTAFPARRLQQGRRGAA